VTVDNGDLVRGDSDGVIFVPWAQLREVLDRADAKLAKEAEAAAAIALGGGLELLYGEFLHGDEEGP
jgi:4-hydroxy-4-methyl-2-oxoglutarate aldolase